jgi:hypothetical protein
MSRRLGGDAGLLPPQIGCSRKRYESACNGKCVALGSRREIVDGDIRVNKESLNLKCCPFCGSEADLMEINQRWVVKCRMCFVKTDTILRCDAITAWQRRQGGAISVIDDAEAVKILSTGYINDQFENQSDNVGCCVASMEAAWQALKPHVRTTEPNGDLNYQCGYYAGAKAALKPVSLEKCAKAAHNSYFDGNDTWMMADGNARLMAFDQAKVVLDAAGVKYAE